MASSPSPAVEFIGSVPIGSIVPHEYDAMLVALSFLISVLGSFAALEMVTEWRPGSDHVSGPAIALGGCAIWAMHFIAMAAYKTPLRVSYDVLPTLGSLLIAIAITGVGFWYALKDPSKFSNLLTGGFVIGGGVLAMHYVGMMGMDIRAATQWDGALVSASVAIAVIAATAALWLAFNVRQRWQRVLAAIAMGLAVCRCTTRGW